MLKERQGLLEAFVMAALVVSGILLVNQPAFNTVAAVYGFYLGALLCVPLFLLHRGGGSLKGLLGLDYRAGMVSAYVVTLVAAPLLGVVLLPSSKLAASLFTFAMAPVCEEIFFRGYLLVRFTRLGRWASVAITAVVFTVAHAAVTYSVEDVVLRFAYAALFAILFLNSGRILVSVSMHIIVNMYFVFSEIHIQNLLGESALVAAGALLVAVSIYDYFERTGRRRKSADGG